MDSRNTSKTTSNKINDINNKTKNDFEFIFINFLLQEVIDRIRKRKRLAAELSDRRSRASQLRMKSIANLASENNTSKRRRKGQEGIHLYKYYFKENEKK